MKPIKKTPISWTEFVSSHIDIDVENTEYIFRGQSNELGYQFKEWNLISSYYRGVPDFPFNQLITQLTDEGKKYLQKNNNYCLNELQTINRFELLFYYQHYGLPTPFIDFTLDPEVALFFAISSMPKSFIKTKGVGENAYISIYKINYRFLIEKLKVKKVTRDDLKERINLNYEMFYFDNEIADLYLGLAMPPFSNIDCNENLRQQKGCLLLYDNHGSPSLSFEDFVEKMCPSVDCKVDKPIIEIFQINYCTLSNVFNRNKPSQNLWDYLIEQKKTGFHLFNDLQGIWYDAFARYNTN